MVDVVGSDGSHNQVPAGIIAPIKVGDRTIGTLKFYYKTPRAVDRTQYALASGFAEIATQLAIHELEVQKELTARAEVRALQARSQPALPVQHAEHHCIVYAHRPAAGPRTAS